MIINNLAGNLETADEKRTVLVKSDGFVHEMCMERTVREHQMDISVNERPFARVVCTPNALAELVAGRLITERVIDMHAINSLEDAVKSIYICENGSRAKVYLTDAVDPDIVRMDIADTIRTEPTCCTGNRTFVTSVSEKELFPLEKAVYKPEWIFALAAAFAEGSLLHRSTKGVHSCYLGVGGEAVYAAEDIGRHNALDKAVGYAVLHGYPLSDCILFTTGRVPTDMAAKAIAARIPVLVSKSVPTDAAIALANRYHLTLICRAWPDSYEVYTD